MLTSESGHAIDVADEWYEDRAAKQKRRIRLFSDDPHFAAKTQGMRLIRSLELSAPDDEDSEMRSWVWFELPRDGDGDGSISNKKAVLLDVHTADVVENVLAVLEKLPLSDDLKRALVLAARFHDLGKARRQFQMVLGNLDAQVLLAKSAKRAGRLVEQYRHEFGSLLDTLEQEEFKALKEAPECQDFILHLIAVHHGYGRPHFPFELAFDPEASGKDACRIAAEVPRRFARLQRKYGRWGLAYLESLLRSADYAASANPSAFVEASP